MSTDDSSSFVDYDDLPIEQLFAAVKSYQRDLEIIQAENFWIQEFFIKNCPVVVKNLTLLFKKYPTVPVELIRISKLFSKESEFEDSVASSRTSRISRVPSRRTTFFPVSSSSHLLRKGSSYVPQKVVNVVFKNDLIEQFGLVIQEEIVKLEKEHSYTLKTLDVETFEIGICCEELQNARAGFEKVVTSERTFIKFLTDISKNGSMMTESIRLKTASLKTELKLQKKVVKKHKELSGCIMPVDFELIEIEKRRFLKTEVEKNNAYLGLRHDEHQTAMKKNLEHKKLLQVTNQLHSVSAKIEESRKVIETLKGKIFQLEVRVEELKKSVNVLKEQVSKFESPSILQYCELSNKLRESDEKLKKAKKRLELLKTKLKSTKAKCRRSGGC